LTIPNSDIVDPEAKAKDYGIPVTTLREIMYLKQVKHENCVELLEIAFEKGLYHLEFCPNATRRFIHRKERNQLYGLSLYGL
jgi:hypothetical protein